MFVAQKSTTKAACRLKVFAICSGFVLQCLLALISSVGFSREPWLFRFDLWDTCEMGVHRDNISAAVQPYFFRDSSATEH